MEHILASNAWLVFKIIMAVLLWYMGCRGLVLGRATERDGTVITGTDARKVGLLFLALAAYLTYTSMGELKHAEQNFRIDVLTTPTPTTQAE